jgi:hypothetical protein
MLTLCNAIPKRQTLATVECVTLRMGFLTIAAQVIETATRVSIAFAGVCPEDAFFRGIALRFQAAER